MSCRIGPVLARPEWFRTCLLLSGGWGRNFNRSGRLLRPRRQSGAEPDREADFRCFGAISRAVAGHSGQPQVPACRGLLHSWAAFGIALPVAGAPIAASSLGCGCSSVVEHDLAKVGVEGSNPFARSRNSFVLPATSLKGTIASQRSYVSWSTIGPGQIANLASKFAKFQRRLCLMARAPGGTVVLTMHGCFRGRQHSLNVPPPGPKTRHMRMD